MAKLFCIECGDRMDYKPIIYCGREIKPCYCNDCVAKLEEMYKSDGLNEYRRSLFGEANIPTVYAEAKKDGKLVDYDHQVIGMAYPVTLNRFPYLYGPPGTGKTFIASKIATDYIIHLNKRVYFNSLTGYKELKIEDKREFWKKKTSHLLVIDDIGNHSITKYTIEVLKDILDLRIGWRMPIIITSNYNPMDLAEMMKSSVDEKSYNVVCDSIADRILELCTPVKVGGESIRKLNFIKEVSNGNNTNNQRKDSFFTKD